ncbi:MAG: LPD38 domain-containing protein, partial [Desulfomicrobium apsheronum]|nr:LPD38 domain-containing protein [Desulfomicrobium apsheronum]
MLNQPMDDYEGSYGKKVESLYLENQEEFSKRGISADRFANALFKAGKNVSEGDTYDTWAQRNKIDRFSQNISAFETKRRQEELDSAEREKNLAERGDFMRGMASGTDQLQATVGGGSLMLLGKLASFAGGDNVVSKYLTNKGFDVYQEQMRQASLNPTKSLLSQEEGKWINDELQGPGDYFDAIAGTLGNLAPSMAVSLISGGVGGKLAELAGRKAVDKTVGYFVKNQAERMLNKGIFANVAKEATEAAVKSGVAVEAATLAGTEASRKVAQVAAQKYVGTRVGTILGTAALESTGAFSDTVNHMRDKFMAEGMSHEDALLKATEETSATFAMSTGLAAGMVEIFGGNIRLLDMFLGDVGGKTAKELVKAATHARANPGLRGKALNMMRDLMVEAVKQAPAEFGQEAAQEILSMANVNFADPDFEMVSQENFKRVIESGLAGAIGGFGGGMATQVGSKAKAAFGTQETPESRARDLDVIIKRQESIIALGQEKSLPGVTAALEANRAERAELAKHLGNVSAGVSYQEAAKQIDEALPNPNGKPFTVKALKNLIRHGNMQELEKGTVDATALQEYITARKPAPEATTQTSQTSQAPATEPMTTMASEPLATETLTIDPVVTQEAENTGITQEEFDQALAENLAEEAATQEAIGQQEVPDQDEVPIFDPETGEQVKAWTPEELAAKFGPKTDGPKFSRATVGFEGPGLGRDRISEHMAKSGLSEVSTVFESMDELAPETRAAVEAKEGQNAPAFWHGGRLHVNAARVRDDDHMADIMSHEIIHPAEEAHVAELAKKLGAEEAVNEWNGTLDRVYSSFTAEIEKMATERGYDKDYDLSTEVGRRGIAGELLADRNIKGTEKFYDKAVVVLKKIVNAVRKTLGLKEMDLGESEVRVLLSKMKGSLEKQGLVAPEGTKFSRAKTGLKDMPRIPMNYRHDGVKNVMRPDLLAGDKPITSTIDAMWEGRRTGTTRSILQVADQFGLEFDKPKAQVGLADLQQIVGSTFYVQEDGKRILAKVDAVVPVTEMTAEEWSQREGWAPEMYQTYTGAGKEGLRGLKEHGKATDIQLDEKQKLRYDFKEDVATGTEREELPLNNVQVQFSIVSKEEIALPKVKQTEKKAKAPVGETTADNPKVEYPDIEKSTTVRESSFQAEAMNFDNTLYREVLGFLVVEDPEYLKFALREPGFKTEHEKRAAEKMDRRTDGVVDSTAPKAMLNSLVDEFIGQAAPKNSIADWTYPSRESGESVEKKKSMRGIEKTYEERLARLRALPVHKKLQLVASTAPENFNELLRSGSAYVKSAGSALEKSLRSGSTAAILSGDVRTFLSGAWSLITVKAASRDTRVAGYGAKANEANAAYRQRLAEIKVDSELSAEAKDKARAEARKARRAALKIARDENARVWQQHMNEVMDSVKAVADLILATDGQIRPQLEAAYGRDWNMFTEGLQDDIKQMKEFVKNVGTLRENLAKGKQAYWSDRAANTPPRLMILEHAAERSVGRMKLENFTSVGERLDYIVAETARELNSVPGANRLPGEAKQLFLDLISNMVATASYTGRLSKDRAESFDDRVKQLSLGGMDSSATGGITSADAEKVLTALSGDKEDSGGMTETELQKFEDMFRMAEILRSTEVMSPALSGVAKTITDMGSVADFIERMQDSHALALNLLSKFGAIGEQDRLTTLAFPGLGNYLGNKVSADKFEHSAQAVEAVGQNIIRNTLKRLNDVYGGKLTINVGTVVPSFTMEVDAEGVQTHELEALKVKIDELIQAKGEKDSKGKPVTYAGLTADEILLGLFGIGQKFGKGLANKFAVQNMPPALGKKLAAAGFLNDYLQPIHEFEKNTDAHKVAAAVFSDVQDEGKKYRTLFGQMEYEKNLRKGAFFDSVERESLNLSPVNGDFKELRSLQPGAILYSEKHPGSVFMIGGRAEFARDERQRPVGEPLYTLVQMKDVDHAVKDYDHTGVSFKAGEKRISVDTMREKGNPKLYTIEQLSAQQLFVVPRVWDVLAGHSVVKKDKNGNVVSDNMNVLRRYEMNSGLLAAKRRRLLSEVSQKSRHSNLVGAAYAQKVFDANGKQFLVVANQNDNPFVLEVTNQPSRASKTGEAIERSLPLFENNSVKRALVSVQGTAANTPSRDKALDELEDAIVETLGVAIDRGLVTKEESEAIRETAMGNIEARLRLHTQEIMDAEQLVDNETWMPAEKDGDETAEVEDGGGGSSPISKGQLSELAKQANEDFVSAILFPFRTVVSEADTKLSVDMRKDAVEEGKTAVEAAQAHLDALDSETSRISKLLQRIKGELSTATFLKLRDRLDILLDHHVPAAQEALAKAEKNLKWATEMSKFRTGAASSFVVGEAAQEASELAQQRERILSTVLDYELDPDKLAWGNSGYFAALPKHMQAKAEALVNTRDSVTGKITFSTTESMKTGKLKDTRTIRALLEGGQEDLAAYILSGLSSFPNLQYETNDKMTTDMARIAYALVAQELPMATKDGSIKKFSELSDKDQGLARHILQLAPVLIAYQNEYALAMRSLKGEQVNLWREGEARKDDAGRRDDLAIMLAKTGLSRIIRTKDGLNLDAIAQGRLEHDTDAVDLFMLMELVATEQLPADLGPGMLGDSLEERQVHLNSIHLMDRTEKAADFPNQTTLDEKEFQRILAENLVDAVLLHWTKGNEAQRAVAEKLVSSEFSSDSESLLFDLMELIKIEGLDPEKQLLLLAQTKLHMDKDANFLVQNIDDIRSFRSVDGLAQYNLQTENERLTNTEVYPAFKEMTMTGVDYALMQAINQIAPGTYKIKVNRQANTGRTPTVVVNDTEGGIDFGERTMTSFGEALVISLLRTHDDAMSSMTISPARRREVVGAVHRALHSLKENELARVLGKFRYRQVGKNYVLDADQTPSRVLLQQRADAILSELNVLSDLQVPVVFHHPGITAQSFLETADRQVEALPLDLISLMETASKKGKKSLEATESLKNLMGFKDRLGRIHVFVGAHANSTGGFDWQEFSKTIYHEAVGHIGLRKVLGAEYDNYMVSVAKRQFGEDRMARVPRDLQIHYAEEFMSHMAEQVVFDAAAGRTVNKNIGTALDRIAAMLARAFRKIMTKLGFDFHVTGFEMREVLYYAFEGSKVAGRSGASSFISPSLIPGENLLHPGEFGQYQPNLIDTVLMKFADYLRRWEMLNRSVIGSGETLGPDQDFISAMRTQKSRIGALSIKADVLTAQFADMFKGESFSVHDVAEITEALHSLERNKLRKHASRLTNKQAQAFLDKHVALGNITRNADGSYGGKAMAPIRHLVEVNKRTIEIARDGGMITAAKAEEMLAGYEFYVPIPGRTGLEKGSDEYYALSGGSRFKEPGDNFTGLPLQEDERDVVGLTFSGLRSRIQEISVNRTNNVLYNFAGRRGKGNPELFHVYLSQEEVQALVADLVDVDVTGVAAYMERNGLKTMPEIPAGLDRDGLKEWERDMGLIPVYRNGELRYMSIVDEGLAKSFHMLNNPKQVGRAMRFMGTINRWLIKMNTSMNPEFFIPNMVRDIGTALNTLSIRENVGGIDGREFARSVLSNVPAAMKVIYANNFNKDKSGFTEAQKELDAMVELFESTGAKIQWAFMETPEETVKSLDSAIRVAQGKASIKEKAASFTSGVEEFMRKSSDVFENATRLAMFVAGIKAGMSKESAALLARETTVDFDRKGEWGGALNTLYMFANAGIQGSLTILRTMKNNPGRAAKHLGAIIGFSFSVAVMNMFMGGDGDDGEPAYFAVNDEVRNGNLIIMLPGMEKGVKIPLPYGYAFFWSIGQEMAQSVLGRKSTGAASMGILGALLNNFNPLETAASLSESHGWVRMLSPTLFDPLVDVGFEKTPFGTPLMPQAAYDDQPDSARHWRSVSASSKAVAQWVNEVTGGSGATEGLVSFSPESLDLLIESTFGGVGKFLSRTTGLIAMPFSAKEFTENDVPIGRRFAVSTMQWEDRSKFKSAYDEIHGVNRTMKTLQENIGMARVPELRAEAQTDAAEFRKANQHILALRVPVNNVYNQAKTIDKQKERLYKSGLSESEIQPQL